MLKRLKAENAKLHSQIVKLEVANISQRARIFALEKQIKKLTLPLQRRERSYGLQLLKTSPALLAATKRMIMQVEEAVASEAKKGSVRK